MISRFKSLSFNNELFFFLLPLFFILHRYVENLEAIKARDAIFLYFNYVLWMVVFFIVFHFIFKNSRKAFLFTFILFLFNFLFGSMHDFLKQQIPNSIFIQYRFIIPLAIVVFSIIFILFKKTNKTFNPVVKYLNFLFLIFIGIEFIQFIIKNNQLQNVAFTPINCDSCSKPDIYLIIADGYAGNKQLREYFNYNNFEFENYLKTKGFYVVDSSISNYPSTILSMSSMLNMEYANKIKGTESHETINKNRLFELLKPLGYQIKNYSFFKIDNQFPYVASRYFQTGTNLIISPTFIFRVRADIGHNLATQLQIKSEIDRLNKLKEEEQNYDRSKDSLVMTALIKEATSKVDHPRFVYSHFSMPHSPYFFDSKGNTIPGRSNKEKDYLEYLQYTNSMMKKAIDHILASNAFPPIIYFMSDHGFRDGKNNELHPYWNYNFNAVYFPDQNYSLLYKGMSNINQFRVLLNKQFNQKLPLLKDTSVYIDISVLGPIK